MLPEGSTFIRIAHHDSSTLKKAGMLSMPASYYLSSLFNSDISCRLDLRFVVNLRYADIQHTILKFSLDVLKLNIFTDVEGSCQSSDISLAADEASLLLLTFRCIICLFALCLNGEVSILQCSCHIVLLLAGKLKAQFIMILEFLSICTHQAASGCMEHRRCPVKCSVKKIINKIICK